MKELEYSEYIITYNLIDQNKPRCIRGRTSQIHFTESESTNIDCLESNKIHIANMILDTIKSYENDNLFKPSTIKCKLIFASGNEFEIPHEIIMARLYADQVIWQD